MGRSAAARATCGTKRPVLRSLFGGWHDRDGTHRLPARRSGARRGAPLHPPVLALTSRARRLRQRQPEVAAVGARGLCLDLPALGLDRAPSDREPEAAARLMGAAALEGLED